MAGNGKDAVKDLPRRDHPPGLFYALYENIEELHKKAVQSMGTWSIVFYGRIEYNSNHKDGPPGLIL